MSAKYVHKKSRALGAPPSTVVESKLAVALDDDVPLTPAASPAEAPSSTLKISVTKKVQNKAPTKAPRKKIRFKPGTVAVRQIRKLQKSTDPVLAMAPFKRIVYETLQNIAMETGGERLCIQKAAVLGLFQETDLFATEFLGEAGYEAIKAGRVTLMPCDIQEAKRLHIDGKTMGRRPRVGDVEQVRVAENRADLEAMVEDDDESVTDTEVASP